MLHIIRTTFSTIVISTALIALNACSSSDDSPSIPAENLIGDESREAADGAESVQAEAMVIGLPVYAALSDTVAMAQLIFSSNPAVGAATLAASKAPTLCANPADITATSSGSTITYTFSNCAGPAGYILVSGTVIYEIKSIVTASQTITLRVISDKLKTTRAAGTGEHSFTADVIAAVGNMGVTYTVDGSASGTGARGVGYTRTGKYTIVETEDQCKAIDGTWQSTVASLTWNTVASKLRVCKDKCPQAGGSVLYDGALNRSTTLTFDGSAVATWKVSGSQTKDGTVELHCVAN